MRSVRERIERLAARGATLTLLWIVLTRGDASSWVVALPTIAIAVGTSELWPDSDRIRVRPLPVLRFAVAFLWRGFLAGLDVSRKATAPRVRIAPTTVEYRLRITGIGPRVFLANTVSLLPGTLSTTLVGDTLRLHVLDDGPGVTGDVARFERLVADMLHAPFALGPEGGPA